MHTLLSSRLSKLALAGLVLAGAAVAWGWLISLFGAQGAPLAVLPALLIGGGGVLTIAQLAQLVRAAPVTVRARR